MKTKFILIFIRALIDVLMASMKEMEHSGDVDPDGVPYSDEYDKQSFLLASLRDILREFPYED